MGGTGSPASWRSFRTFIRFTRSFTSFFTLSSPTRESSWAMSCSKSGFSAGSSAAAFFPSAAPPASALLPGALSMKLGSSELT